jgi:putative membrane protein
LWTAAFPHVIRRSLRDERELPEVSRLLGPADASRIAKAEHMPGVVSGELSRMLHHAADHGMSQMAFFQAEQQRSQLIDNLGACERIRNTPLARSSAIQVRRFILMFLVSLPFALLGQFDYELFTGATIFGVVLNARLLLVPLFVMMMAYPLLSLDRIGMELQNPFDTRRLDHLPLDDLCRTIERNLMELLRADTVAGKLAPELQSTDLPPHVIQALAGTSPHDTYIS